MASNSHIRGKAPAPLQRSFSHRSLELTSKEKIPRHISTDVTDDVARGSGEKQGPLGLYPKLRPYISTALALLIFGWWISATVMKGTRHRWIVQTIFAWAFILIIAFRYIPNSVVTRPVSVVWMTSIQQPWYKLPYRTRLVIGWLFFLGMVFGSAFGFPLQAGVAFRDRVINVLGLFVFQVGFYITSNNRAAIPWPTIIVGLFLQQVVALFVLKTGAGPPVPNWIATLAKDFLNQALAGAVFSFDQDSVNKHWFFINTLGSIFFFVAFIQMMYYFGVMQWILKHFAWFFFKIMDISGAEAIVATASPWIGQGESACLVRPYVDLMTESELHLIMTSGFSTIAGAVVAAYIGLGVPAINLVTSSVMSIPASMAISKMRIPETEEPVTRGHITIDRGLNYTKVPANALHALSEGAAFGLVVAGHLLTNVLTVLSLVSMINGLLTWIGLGFGIHQLTLQLIVRYIFYPFTFFIGVPRGEILVVSEFFATKLVVNEFVAYSALQNLMKFGPNPLSPRAYTICSYGLCGFANFGSLGIQIGVLGALAPSRRRVIARIAFSAMICGFLSTLQTAGIVGMLV